MTTNGSVRHYPSCLDAHPTSSSEPEPHRSCTKTEGHPSHAFSMGSRWLALQDRNHGTACWLAALSRCALLRLIWRWSFCLNRVECFCEEQSGSFPVAVENTIVAGDGDDRHAGW